MTASNDAMSVEDYLSMVKCTDTLEKPCLGRPFQLGMLYDCRTDSLIPGLTLWGSEVLSTATFKAPLETSDFEVIAEDTLSKKMSCFGVDASLKLSLLSGMVHVGGAAKFLNDRKSPKKNARISLKYKSTTKFEQLTMDHLGNFEYEDVFDKDIATHVVTGIVYGADAFLVFTRCAYAQGRVKRLSPSIYLFVGVCVCVWMCVSSKNTAVCCLTARNSPRNSSLPLGLAIYILRKMPRKPDESSVECYGHGFLIASSGV